MLVISVESNDNPYVAYLGVEEGNIDLAHGIRCIVQFQNAENQVLQRKLYQLNGAEYQSWRSADTGGFQALIHRILQWANCRACEE